MNGNGFPAIPRAVAIVALAMLFGGVESIQGQTAPGAGGASQSPRPMMIDEAQAGGMMAQRQQMMASMRALDQPLEELIARIDTARGNDEKVDAIAAVVKVMAARRVQMREQMREQMMDNCSMMKEMEKEAIETGHGAHHPQN
jgi:hypothetical protein